MKKDYQIWNTLHDGALVEIQGDVPGDLRVKVEIEYLANKLSGQKSNIWVNLKNCSLFEYERQLSKDETQTYQGPQELKDISPSLMALSCDEEKDYLIIWDICGLIKTKYDAAELFLETGEPLTFEELDNVSKEYWEDFGSQKST